MTKDFNWWLKWIACAVTLVGALCTSLQLDPANIWFLNAGCVIYLAWSLRIREWSLVTINCGLLAIYMFGIYVRS